MTLPGPKSITHQHLLCVLNTFLRQFAPAKDQIFILDAGCGNGDFIHYLHRSLQLLHPEKSFVIHGFDVSDHGVQSNGFLSASVANLNALEPGIDWTSRIFGIRQDQAWNFNAQKYDFILSNQVLEHVRDKDGFFLNINRKLTEGGRSIHLAPLRSVVPEDHVKIPFAHRFTNFGALHAYVRLMSSLGVGKFGDARRRTGVALDEYAERHADYLYHWTAYSSETETLAHARRHFMRADYRFTLEFYTSKLRQILGRRACSEYRFRSYGFRDAIMIKFLRYLSSVTLITEKKNTY